MSDTVESIDIPTMWETDCIHCDGMRIEALLEKDDFVAALQTRMILCPDCGNKRCPKATHHDNVCSGSNAPGQTGSAYGFVRTT